MTSERRPADSVAVVTGASRGIGRAVAIELANRGQHVLATMRDPAASTKLLEEAGPAADLIEVASLDVTDPGDFAFPAATAVLVNNAGGMEADLPFEATPLDQWRRTFELNVFAAVELTRRVVPVMRSRGGGVICNFSTAATLQPTPWVSAYRAAKAAVSALDDTLRIELEPFGIRVIEIIPAVVQTDAYYESAAARPPEASRFEAYAEMAKRTSSGFEHIRTTSADAAAVAIVDSILDPEGPMRRGCDPVARAALKYWRNSSDEELYETAVSRLGDG
jgi:NAD(P)-dependent dehydrogenase (short-subunit alcohol dehydrogenase family)